MNTHKNARRTLMRRIEMVRSIADPGLTPAAATRSQTRQRIAYRTADDEELHASPQGCSRWGSSK